ncbi:hypothetical protein HPP92_026770, partial [Vanilla planifolia]
NAINWLVAWLKDGNAQSITMVNDQENNIHGEINLIVCHNAHPIKACHGSIICIDNG